MYRQGDVLIVPCKIYGDLEQCESVTLAYGEVTGHAHVLTAPRLKARINKTQGRLVAEVVSLMERGLLRHEEHNPIELPPGDYAIIRQREYTPEELRNVAD